MCPHTSDQSLEWAVEYLTTNNIAVLKQKRVVHTPYSKVHKIETRQGIFYLKQTPEALFLEAKMLVFLNSHSCNNIPNLITENSKLYCFLMTSCGDISLRHLFKGQVNLTQLNQGIINYTKIQRSLEGKPQTLLEMGILDWRLNQFASLYSQLLQQEELLSNDGLTKKEIDKLHQLHPQCVELCNGLSQYNITETLNHCDFHENNMLLDRKTGAVNIIDWGEVVLTHPFLSLNGCLWNINYFNKISQDDLNQLKLQCVTPWLDLYGIDDLFYLFNMANQLLGIYAALAYEQMYLATQHQSHSVHQEKKGSIAGCLRTFYNSVDSL